MRTTIPIENPGFVVAGGSPGNDPVVGNGGGLGFRDEGGIGGGVSMAWLGLPDELSGHKPFENRTILGGASGHCPREESPDRLGRSLALPEQTPPAGSVER
jgi:hypothetical protein